MKPASLVAVVSLLFFTGCNLLVNKDTVILDRTPRAPTARIDVYKDAELPDRKYTAIAELSWSGPRSDELRSQRYFMQRAEGLGASAIIFQIANVEHEANATFASGLGAALASGATRSQWLFKAKAIVYEP